MVIRSVKVRVRILRGFTCARAAVPQDVEALVRVLKRCWK